jgi:exosortase E/protease (VPEID-CTERM system)
VDGANLSRLVPARQNAASVGSTSFRGRFPSGIADRPAIESGSEQLWSFVLLRRLVAMAVLFSIELGVITVSLDNDHFAGGGIFSRLLRDWGPSILRGSIVFPVIFLTFAFLRFRSSLAEISDRMGEARVHWPLLAIHTLALAIFGLFSHALYGAKSPAWPALAAFVWLIAGLSAICLGMTAFIRPGFWRQLVDHTEYLWIIALSVAVVAALGSSLLRQLWPVATSTTFFIVQLLLRPFGAFTANPAAMSIGNSRFTVEIAPTCSGLEGIGLILAFTTVWLVLFRRECRFPQALILLPAGAAIAFLLNSVRIAALILLGSIGFDGVAAGGFHSQAGWISFNLLALGICLMARDLPWISVNRSATKVAGLKSISGISARANPTAAWVVPFVAILAAGMVSRAVSAEFEWLYSLRFFAAAIALWVFRGTYAELDWRVDWTSGIAGLVTFLIWIGLDHSAHIASPSQLGTAPPAIALEWIALRTLGSLVTVPIAEELAFRGFLLRRIISADFEAVSFRRFSWIAWLASSLIFGSLHGTRWLAGCIAGAIYALAAFRRGRLSDAIVAHATTNALLALDVLAFHRWSLW